MRERSHVRTEQKDAANCLQRPLVPRSRFRQRLILVVRPRSILLAVENRGRTRMHRVAPRGKKNPGQKAQILGFDLFEEAVHLGGILHVLRMHHTQEIDRDCGLPHELRCPYHLLVGLLLAFGDTHVV